MPQSKPNIITKQTRNPTPGGEEQFYLSGAEVNTVVNFFESKLDVINFVWENLSNRPLTFPPVTHTHTPEQIIGLIGILENKADLVHTHEIADIINLQNELEKYNESQLVNILAPLKFDLDYQVGSSLTPVSGNITFDITDATPGSACSVFHQDISAPTLGTNIKLVFIGFTLADYGDNELNEFVFHYMEDPQNSDEPYLKVYHSKNITVIPSI